MMRVLTQPGHSTLTPMPCGASSSRSASERPTTANLVAVYDVNLSESIDRSLGGAFDRLVIADVADHPSHFRGDCRPDAKIQHRESLPNWQSSIQTFTTQPALAAQSRRRRAWACQAGCPMHDY